ncbi:hypothetical protein FKM82_007949 [Ascaphus truei]
MHVPLPEALRYCQDGVECLATTGRIHRQDTSLLAISTTPSLNVQRHSEDIDNVASEWRARGTFKDAGDKMSRGRIGRTSQSVARKPHAPYASGYDLKTFFG